MTNDELTQFFATKEWYDNSRIKMLRGCKRKAYFQLIGPRGQALSGGVGDGANFGSSMHAGLARYYNGWHGFDEPARRVHAARAFAEEWELYFPHERMQNKHSLARGLDILDAYFDHYLAEDSEYEPVEAELGFALEIKPDKPYAFRGAPEGIFRSFWYIGRVDGIFKRRATGEVFLRETKTTSSQAENRLRQLKFDHQPVGYTYCVRNLSGDLRHDIVGYIGDVILVAATKLEFARDYFHVSRSQAESWRRQMINTVEDWRALRAQAQQQFPPGHDTSGCTQTHVDLDRFYQDTERCFEYGKCAFYDLCDYGIDNDTVNAFEPATWNPLLKRTPTTIEVATENDVKQLEVR